MQKKKYFFIISGIVLTISVIIIIIFSLSAYTLELRTFEENKLVFKQKIQPGDRFTLKYTHSVAKTPVWEMFLIDKNYQIKLVETDFLDHGAGLPYAAFGEEIFIEEDERFKIKNMNRIIHTPIYYRIGAIRENIFYFEDKIINLSSLIGDKLLTIKICKKNLFKYFLGGRF
ncbi:MAG: DUF1850 domain-containing protein [Candidatus Caldatribacteriota bacterium]|nr:DUF1850 domain-containing protein [Candidatus Caldatribacteriota bacterium]